MGETILFCIVFACQVLSISWLFPRRVINRGRYVLQNFPPSTHPRLYPYPPEHFQRWLRNIGRINLAIVGAGFSIIVGLVLATLGGWDGKLITPWSASGEWDAAIVNPFFLVQLATGFGYMNFSGRKLLQAMAKAPPPRVRTTELRRRRLVDFVSPTLLVVAALTNAAFIVFLLFYRRFGFTWFTAAGNIVVVAFMLLVFSASIGVALRAPKLDPYQAHQDRSNLIKLVVQQALGFCIAYPVLITVWLTIKIFDPDLLEPVIASLYCQGIAVAVLWPSFTYRVDQVDFDVYRRDAGDPSEQVLES
jgi:hypothetical protein